MERGTANVHGEQGPAVATRLRGVTPSRQARSEATFRALVAAGRTALEDKCFEEMTIGDIARVAGVSVGAFYGRFANKEAFFSAIQEITVSGIEAALRARLARPALDKSGAAEFLATVASFSVGVFRTHRGFYVACSQHSSARPGAWSPIRRLGQNVSGIVAAKLAPLLRSAGRPASEREIRVGLQFMNGFLVNAVLNNPGPLSLDDREVEPYVVRMLCSFFALDRAARSGSGKSGRRGGRRRP